MSTYKVLKIFAFTEEIDGESQCGGLILECLRTRQLREIGLSRFSFREIYQAGIHEGCIVRFLKDPAYTLRDVRVTLKEMKIFEPKCVCGHTINLETFKCSSLFCACTNEFPLIRIVPVLINMTEEHLKLSREDFLKWANEQCTLDAMQTAKKNLKLLGLCSFFDLVLFYTAQFVYEFTDTRRKQLLAQLREDGNDTSMRDELLAYERSFFSKIPLTAKMFLDVLHEYPTEQGREMLKEHVTEDSFHALVDDMLYDLDNGDEECQK